MRSRLLQILDYRTVDVAPMVEPFALDEEALERELNRIINPYIRWERENVAAAGGQVICRLVSVCDRFNREKVKFVAGSGMFHKDLETLSIGMAVGETREIELPEGKVALTVTEVMNRIVPEPSDEMVQKLALEGVSTLEKYRAYLAAAQKKKYLESAIYKPVQYLSDKVLEGSEFVLFKEDWRYAVEQKLNRNRALARHEGMVLEEMTAEQFNGRIPVKSYHELVSMIQDEAWNSLRMYLLGMYYAQSDGFSVTEADYETYIQEYAQNWHTTAEEAREIDPYRSYEFNEYCGHALDIFRQYVKKYF